MMWKGRSNWGRLETGFPEIYKVIVSRIIPDSDYGFDYPFRGEKMHGYNFANFHSKHGGATINNWLSKKRTFQC